MPLFFQHSIDNFSELIIWKIEEDENELNKTLSLNPEISHPQKRLEFFTGRKLIAEYLKKDPTSLKMTHNGKPYFENFQGDFSLSHSFPYVVLLYSQNACGVDLQVYDPKIEIIKKRFCVEDELRDHNLYDLSTIWCSKEAVYKWYNKGNVNFIKNIHIQKWVENLLEINFKNPQTQIIQAIQSHYKIFDDFCLAWVV